MEVFLVLWIELDGWVRKQISTSEGGLSGYLKRHAPVWRRVGRVCFHLAENWFGYIPRKMSLTWLDGFCI